ncbi:transcriptional regulatory protein [Zygosaccharomyces mellis]|uniref:Transcriptional regulatory protein n=1 Tax=Zygosaccharomyces mellis TaxID=42258 RepID=A0A4C2E6H8_9SACH|nr:transcriptional regulatory protein [Zygosaccharomyces mellis]
MDSQQDNTHSNQEAKSVLSKVNSNSNRENNDSNPLDNFIPSDADTERMGEEADHGTPHPKLEELAENKRSVADMEDKEEPESKSLKRPKRDSQAPEIPDEEGDVEEEEEEEAEEESSEQKTTTVKEPGPSAGVDADADVDVEEEEEIEEMGEEEEEGDSKERDISKRISSMQSPIEVEEQRQTALQEITDIEYKFAELRQRLFENKMLRLKTELQMCMEGSHPRLQTYYQKIASIRDHKLKRAYQRQKYNMQCIDTETRATRTHIHQDFLKKVSDLRSKMLTDTTQTWYDINKERREMDIVVPEINYHVPVKLAGKTLSCITGYAGPAQQRFPGEPLPEDLECENITFRYRSNAVDKLEVIVDRMRLNNELSDLEGLRRYFNGFPGAPNLSGLRDSEIYEDLLRLQDR